MHIHTVEHFRCKKESLPKMHKNEMKNHVLNNYRVYCKEGKEESLAWQKIK